MNLEEALDIMLFEFERYVTEEDPEGSTQGYIDAYETLLRCADEEWQSRQGPVHPLWAYHIDGGYVWPENLWKEFIVTSEKEPKP